MLIGSAPLLILIKNSELTKKIFNLNKIVLIFVILNIFVPIHWLMFIDWGRAVNITYVSSTLFFFYLFKNDFIKIDFKSVENKILKIVNDFQKLIKIKAKTALTIFFLIFAFGWSPPTLLSADVNSFPGYRIPYKTIKFLYLSYQSP
tara:strand:- start:283 stop:723 length:441 start_codon:yes stop_codon:yes gene_type:complete